MTRSKALGCLLDALPSFKLNADRAAVAHLEILGIEADSRKLLAGQIFCALVGLDFDGHRFLKEAKAKGAKAALVERVDPSLDLIQIEVDNSRKAMALISVAFFDDPSADLVLTGITGSNGKTTTSLMVQEIFRAHGLHNGLIGTVSIETGSESLASKLTTPESYHLQHYFAQMRAQGFTDAIMEVSSVGQKQWRVYGSHYDLGAFINCEREHIDDHGSMEAYFHDKQQLITTLAPTAVAVLNLDNPYTASLVTKTKAKVLSFAHQAKADVQAEALDLKTGFPSFDCVVEEACAGLFGPILPQKTRVTLKVPGYASMMNAMAALSMGLARGIPLETCKAGVEAYTGVERRFEEIYAGAFRIFDDHFANTGNIQLTLTTMLGMEYKKLHILYAIRGKRGVTVNEENVLALLPFVPKIRLETFIASLSKDTVGPHNEVTEAELAVFDRAMNEGGVPYTLSEELTPAIMTLLDKAQPGDVILFGGAQGIDDGARIALTELSKRFPEQKEKILRPLATRVCGWNTKEK